MGASRSRHEQDVCATQAFHVNSLGFGHTRKVEPWRRRSLPLENSHAAGYNRRLYDLSILQTYLDKRIGYSPVKKKFKIQNSKFKTFYLGSFGVNAQWGRTIPEVMLAQARPWLVPIHNLLPVFTSRETMLLDGRPRTSSRMAPL